MVSEISSNGLKGTDPLRVFGLTGLKQASGFLFADPMPMFEGTLGRNFVTEMIYNSSVIGAGLLAIEVLARQSHVEVLPADDSSQAQDIAQFVDDCRHDMVDSFEDHVANQLIFFPYGWGYFELEYKSREGPQDDLSMQLARVGKYDQSPIKHSSKFNDGKIGWHRFSLRSQQSLLKWEFTPDGSTLLGMWQIPAPTYQLLFVPYAKSVNYRTRSYNDSPEGVSGLRNVFTTYQFVKSIMSLEGIGIERDLAGLPLMRVPSEIMQANPTTVDGQTMQAYRDIVRSVRNDEQAGIIMPSDRDDKGNLRYEFELVSSAGQKAFNTSEIIGRYEQRMLMTMLADFLLIGTQGPGSRALIDPRMNLFSLNSEVILRQTAAIDNSRAIPQLLALNRMPLELAPKLMPGRVNLVKLLDLANYILAISQANQASPLAPDVRQELLRRGDLPTADTGATVEDSQPNEQLGQDQSTQQQPNANGTPQQQGQQQPPKAATAATAPNYYPDVWPDKLVHAVADLMTQKPSDISQRFWAGTVIQQAQESLKRGDWRGNTNARVFQMGETKPQGTVTPFAFAEEPE